MPTSVRWVDNQQRRWGSCTPVDGSIRLSRRLATMPAEVRDYVLLHELAHLLESGHGPAFEALLAGYGPLERARGFLDGVAFADAVGAAHAAGSEPAGIRGGGIRGGGGPGVRVTPRRGSRRSTPPAGGELPVGRGVAAATLF